MVDKQDIIIYKTGDGKASVALYAKDGNVWLTQKQLAELFATSRSNITMHISNILKEKELNQNSVCKDFLLTAADGKNYSVAHYSLSIDFWRKNADTIIQSNDFSLLQGKGTVTKQQMQQLALTEYEQFDARRKVYEAQLADKQDEEELKQLETQIKKRQQEQK